MRFKNIFKRNSKRKNLLIHSYNFPYLEIMESCRKGAMIGAGHKRKFVSEDGTTSLTFYGTLYESSYEFFEADCDVWYENEKEGKVILHEIDSHNIGPSKVEVKRIGSKEQVRDWLLEINCNFKEEGR